MAHGSRLTARIMLIFVVSLVSVIFEAPKIIFVHTYNSSQTTKSTCPQPPSNVDHATFSDSQLQLYGLPPRGSHQLLSEWQQLVRNAKIRVCEAKSTNTYHDQRPTKGSAAYSNRIWSGYESYGYGYDDVIGQWNVPCLTLRLTRGVASQWVGIGGDPNYGGGNLIQAGTETDEDSFFPGYWYQSSYAWYEDANNQPIQEVFGVNCGDTIYTVVYQNSSSIQYYIGDWTSGKYYNSPMSNVNLANGSTAEWVVERTDSSTTNTLADFNYVNFTQCLSIRNGYATSIVNTPYTAITMYGSSGQIDAAPSLLSNDSTDIGNNFTDDWYHGN